MRRVVPYLRLMVSEREPRGVGGDKTAIPSIGIVMEGIDSRRDAEAQ